MDTDFTNAAQLATPAGMSTSFAICTAIWNGLIVPIEASTGALSGALEGWMRTQYPAWVGAYLLIMLIMNAYRGDQDGFMAAMRTGFLAAIIYAFCSNATTFNYYITGLFHGTVASISNGMAGVFGGGGQRVTAGVFDQLGARAFAVGSKVFAVIPWYSLKGLALCIPVVIYWAVSLTAVAVMFTLWMVSYVSTDIILAFGPLFVGLYTIPFLRPTALGAFRVAASGGLTQILLVGTLVLFLKVLQTVLGSVAGLSGDLANPTVNTANTPVAGEGDIASSLYALFFGAAACAVFLYVVWDIIKIARAIVGAPSAYVPNWRALANGAGAVAGGASSGFSAVSAIGGTSGGSSGAAGGAAGAAGGAAAGAGRQYAFQRATSGANVGI